MRGFEWEGEGGRDQNGFVYYDCGAWAHVPRRLLRATSGTQTWAVAVSQVGSQ